MREGAFIEAHEVCEVALKGALHVLASHETSSALSQFVKLRAGNFSQPVRDGLFFAA
jgi:hypothetical protein